MNAALAKLRATHDRTGSLLSAGLEPAPQYLPRGFDPTPDGYERFLLGMIEATRGLVCAYKANLAFFEALGAAGWAMLERVRAAVPDDVLFIADAKRGDIGSTAEHYARAMYETLGADSCTVNPLMGRDSVEPWLAYRDKLTFFLVLTSNPGASDFLLADGLYSRIGRRLVEWGGEMGVEGSVGFVVGATRSDCVGELRRIGGDVPFLVPGVGAQGGSIRDTIDAGRSSAGFPGLLFHMTRGLLPGPDDAGDPLEIIRHKAEGWCASIAQPLGGGTREAPHGK